MSENKEKTVNNTIENEIKVEIKRIAKIDGQDKVAKFLDNELQKLKNVTLENIDEALVNKEEQYKADLKTAGEQYVRLLADTDNYKKRIATEAKETKEYANINLIEKMIPNIDLFEKVVNQETEDPVLKNFLIGFNMICKSLLAVLEGEGVKKIVVKVGDKFDPKYHHAVETAEDVNYEDGVILAEMQTGYLYKERIVRNAMVKVNKIQKIIEGEK
jgi:molecular chaperone GrpE